METLSILTAVSSIQCNANYERALYSSDAYFKRRSRPTKERETQAINMALGKESPASRQLWELVTL